MVPVFAEEDPRTRLVVIRWNISTGRGYCHSSVSRNGRVRLNLSVRPVAHPSRLRVPAPSRCEDDAGGETPPALAGGDACATTDTFNRTHVIRAISPAAFAAG